MEAQPTGKQAITVSYMTEIARPRPTRPQGTGNQVRPEIDIPARITHHDGPAGGAAGGMDPHQLFAGHGEHAEWIVIPQILFGGEREAGKVGQFPYILRMHTRRIEVIAVKRYIFIGILKRPAQALELQRLEFVEAGVLNRFQSRPVQILGHQLAPS